MVKSGGQSRRLKYFQQHPPLPDWHGIYSLNNK
jgi:hypothetical protein